MSKRPYKAPQRQRMAQETRRAIMDAAAALMADMGFDQTTIAEIAKAADVSIPSVYAVFGSKARIVQELLNRARFGEAYLEAVSRVHRADSPRARLQATVGIAREVYSKEMKLLDLWCGADAISPELAALATEAGEQRREGQKTTVAFLREQEALKRDLTPDAAADLLWALTSRDLYRLLVLVRGWSDAEYETRVAELLCDALIEG